MKELLNEKDMREIALTLYELAKDVDFEDYEDNKDEELKDIEDFLYHLKALAQNEYNNEYFRTFYNLLQRI